MTSPRTWIVIDTEREEVVDTFGTEEAAWSYIVGPEVLGEPARDELDVRRQVQEGETPLDTATE